MIYRGRRTILYVDDTVEQRYAMRRILELEGYVVIEAGTGKEALAHIDDPLALAVVDVRLPDIDGYDLSRRIKIRKPHLPILQVSAAFGDPSLRASGLSGGADAYIAQPVYPSELIALVRRMVQSSEAEESLRFLASIGPAITSSLSVEDTVTNIRTVMVPTFADRCEFYLRGNALIPPRFWNENKVADQQHQSQMEAQSETSSVLMIDSRHLMAPLLVNDIGYGTISFELNEEREYTKTDSVLAADLANRAGLALQNCILFASEQAAKSALVNSEKLATAGRMAAAMAHEINNPLESVTNLLYLIESDPSASAEIKATANSALAEITRIAHITRQSLGFYRELRAPSILDLSDSVRDAVELYRKRLDANQIDVRLDLAHGVEIRGIKGEIRQVISNLLVNAIEAAPADGMIAISTFMNESGSVVLTIEDNGSGVEESTRARIFEPFFTTKSGTGTGLGLWITQTIIQKHHGSISLCPSVASANGARFEVVFPPQQASPESHETQLS